MKKVLLKVLFQMRHENEVQITCGHCTSHGERKVNAKLHLGQLHSAHRLPLALSAEYRFTSLRVIHCCALLLCFYTTVSVADELTPIYPTDITPTY